MMVIRAEQLLTIADRLLIAGHAVQIKSAQIINANVKVGGLTAIMICPMVVNTMALVQHHSQRQPLDQLLRQLQCQLQQ